MIVSAKESDLPDLQRLNKQIFEYEIEHCSPDGWNPNFPYEKDGIAYLNKAIKNEEGYAGFVYKQQDNNIGYIILRLVPNEDTIHRNDVILTQIHTLCVDTPFRGRGIGQELIEFSKKWAKEKEASHIKVVAMAQNSYASSIYKKVGFEEFEVAFEMPLKN